MTAVFDHEKIKIKLKGSRTITIDQNRKLVRKVYTRRQQVATSRSSTTSNDVQLPWR